MGFGQDIRRRAGAQLSNRYGRIRPS